MLKSFIPFLAVFAGWSGAQEAELPSSADNACALVNESVQDFVPSEGQLFPSVPAKLAYDCMRSVPINIERAAELIHSLSAYSEFQTILAYLKDPPNGYPYPAIDIIQELDDLALAVESGEFESEYDYAVKLFVIYERSRDGHFRFYPDILFSVFAFRRSIVLASVSEDGAATPQIFNLFDLLQDDFEPSPIVAIDGQDVTEYLEGVIVGSSHDPDASYNAMLYSPNPVFNEHGGAGFFARPELYPGEETTVEFANGTTAVLTNTAEVQGDFSSVDSPQSYYDTFCNLTAEETQAQQDAFAEEFFQQVQFSVLSTEQEEEPNSLLNRPVPVLSSGDQQLNGYFLEEPENEDVAVLSVPTFVFNDIIDIQNTVGEFIRLARQKNKSRLIVDLQSNAGGFRILGFDTFGQIIPDIQAAMPDRQRAHESANILGTALDTAFADESIFSPENITPEVAALFSATLNYRKYVPLDADFGSEEFVFGTTPFDSYEDFYGPFDEYNDTFTAVFQENLSLPPHLLTIQFYATGFGNLTAPENATRPFEDIIVLTDGICASTCSILTDLLTRLGNVRTVTIGGRPQDGPMMAVGATRGTRSVPLSEIGTYAQIAANLTSEEELPALSASKFANLTDAPAMRFSPLRKAPAVNYLDTIRPDDGNDETNADGATPLQFIYEAASCRLYHTTETILDIRNTWSAAARVMKGDYDACVKGSVTFDEDTGVANGVNNATSTSGGSFNATEQSPNSSESEPPVSKTEENIAVRMIMASGITGVATVLVMILSMI